MLELERFEIDNRAIKEEQYERVKKYVLALVRNEELKTIISRKSYKTMYTVLCESHADIDPLTCDEVIVRQDLKINAEKFLEERKNVNCLKRICSELPSIQDIYSLNITDRAHIELIAHMIYRKVVLDSSFFEDKLGGSNVPFDSIVQWGANGHTKDILRSIFYHVFGHEGELFYAVKIKKSDLKNEYINHFIIGLIKKTLHESNVEAFTDFCAIVLYTNSSNCTVIRPEIDGKKTIQIGIEDFVVKGNLFQCRKKEHKIQDISALIQISDENRNIRSLKIPAGYCEECKVFFILESIYQSIKNEGMILCRIIDEKKYIPAMHMNGGKYASESLLMQYGYNVSNVYKLPKKYRQNILAFIIDYKIMTKSEIISYLDFFIGQRKTLENMKNAISKWEEDKQFIKNYNIDNIEVVKVATIYRK